MALVMIGTTLSGCNEGYVAEDLGGQETPLSELPDARIVGEIHTSMSTVLTLSVEYGPGYGAPDVTSEEDCLHVPGLTITIDGEDVTTDQAGGGWSTEDQYCTSPGTNIEWRGTYGDEATNINSFVVSDSEGNEIVMELIGVNSDHEIVLETPADGVLVPDETVSLKAMNSAAQWADYNYWAVDDGDFRVDISWADPAGGIQPTNVETGARTDGNSIDFTVPAGLERSTDVSIFVWGELITGVQTCEGVASCRIFQERNSVDARTP